MESFKRAVYGILVFSRFIMILFLLALLQNTNKIIPFFNMYSSIASLIEIFVPLYDFLKTASLEKITISRIFTQQWKLFKIQSKEEDCKCLINILRSVEDKIVNTERKEHIQSLQDINRVNNVVHYRYYYYLLKNDEYRLFALMSIMRSN